MVKAVLNLPKDLERYLFIDVEASGLHAYSYPIEIGWCGLDLASDSFLIKPHPSWGEEGWSYTSERIHGSCVTPSCAMVSMSSRQPKGSMKL